MGESNCDGSYWKQSPKASVSGKFIVLLSQQQRVSLTMTLSKRKRRDGYAGRLARKARGFLGERHSINRLWGAAEKLINQLTLVRSCYDNQIIQDQMGGEVVKEVNAQFHAPATLSPGKSRYQWNRKLAGPQSLSGRGDKEMKPALPRIKARFSSP